MKYSFLIAVIFFYLSGCMGDPGPAGPTLSGDIAGRIYLYTDNGLRLQDNSGVQVSIEGSIISTLSLSDGSWKLSGVPAGIYTIVFSKPGFIANKYFNIQFVGGGTLSVYSNSLAQISTISVTQFKLTKSNTNNSLNIQGKISSADSLSRTIMILFSKVPISVSPTMSYLFSMSAWIQPDSTTFSQVFNIYDYMRTEYGLPSGTNLYAIAFALPRGGYYSSYNPLSDIYEVYNSGILFSNIESILIP